jgi:adenylate kinase
VITFIERKMIPIVLRHAISGVAQINTEDPVSKIPSRWPC